MTGHIGEISLAHDTIMPSESAPVRADDMEPLQALLTGRGRYLDDSTLLTIWLAMVTGTHRRAEEIATVLLKRFGTMAALLTTSDRELSGIAGLGPQVVPAIRVLQDSALRYNRARLDQNDVLSDAPRLLDYLTARLARETVEQFRILFLSETRRLIVDEAQARGTVNHTPVYPREVARRALELGATFLVLVHNHPSGDPTPSDADRQMTKLVQNAARLVGVEILDHLIIGNGRHTSFLAAGLL